MFVFFIQKQLMIKDLIEIERYQLKKSKNLLVLTVKIENTQFSINNSFKVLKVSSLSQVCNLDKEKILNSNLVIESETSFNSIDNNNVIATLLTINVESF